MSACVSHCSSVCMYLSLSSLACLSGSASINKVTLRRVQLLLGWVTLCGRINHLRSVCNSHSGQLSLLPSAGRKNEYLPKCVDAVRLGSKGRYSSFHLWIVWVVVKLCDASLTCAISEHFRYEFLMVKLYTNLRLPGTYFALLYLVRLCSVGSPFHINVIDPSKATARGDGLDMVQCNQPTSFYMCAPAAQLKDFDVKIIGKLHNNSSQKKIIILADPKNNSKLEWLRVDPIFSKKSLVE